MYCLATPQKNNNNKQTNKQKTHPKTKQKNESERNKESEVEIVSWCFEPSQPDRIISEMSELERGKNR